MAKAKPVKSKPISPKAHAEAVEQVSAEVEARLVPDGVAHGLFGKGGGLAKLIPELVTPLLKIAGMGIDGRLSADEAREIADIAFEALSKVLSRRSVDA